MYNFYGICVLCKSPVLCGVVPRLYTQVSRAEVTTSKYTGGHSCVWFIIMSDFYWSLFLCCNQNFFFKLFPLRLILLYPQTKVGDILDSGPSRRRRRRRRRNFLVDAITQKQINIFFSNLVHMLRVPKGRSLF